MVAAAVFLAIGRANWDDTSPGIDLDKLPRFPMTKMRSGILPEGERVAFDGITAEAAMGRVRLRGRAWDAEMCWSCFNDVWRADLDGNGTQDFAISGGGPFGNGRTTALYSLHFLLMDKNGLPTPFWTAVWHGGGGKAVKNVVDLDRDGRAEVLISIYDESPSDPRAGPFCSGHWVTQRYRFTPNGVEEIRMAAAGISFPFVNKWTYVPRECPALAEPQTVASPLIIDEGTTRKGEVTTRIGTANDTFDLKIDPVESCHTIYARTIVHDRGDTRSIAFENLYTDASYKAQLAKAILADGGAVTLRGIAPRGDGYCTVNLVWASR